MLLNYYGITQSAESKYTKFLQALIKFKDGNPKLTLFASFIGINQYNEGDFDFYIKGFYFITKIWYFYILD